MNQFEIFININSLEKNSKDHYHFKSQESSPFN